MKLRSALLLVPATLALAAGLLVPATAGGATARHGQAPNTLRELAKQQHIKIGSAVDVTALADEADYRRVLNREFNNITAENAMKWESVEPQRGVFDWSGADAIVANAKRNRQTIRGHTLVWHNQLPTWITDNEANFTAQELRGILRNHIMTEAGRYRGQIRAWDVLNEAVADGGGLRDTIWLRKLGPGYIADLFRWAHQADPHAKLYYNDYNLESDQAKYDTMLQIVTDLRKKRVPIHGVGFQGHLDIQFGFPDFADRMKRVTDLGLEVAITEADVRMDLPTTDEKLATQASYYSQMMTACLDNRRCTEYTVWGYTDRHSWVPGFFEGQGAACLFDENLAPKPAYNALLALGKRR
ncbi:MAG TPA: endo-1,4-beta-xylanase [Streptosporangiaceae bacterium]|nr:endo-1,4-beta-xylanase [Streptosporangiaceae bacterium]